MFIGYGLKKKQTEVISSVSSGSDVLVVLPISFGKFMIYQALPWNLCNSPCNISTCCHNEESSGAADEEERDQYSSEI